MSRDLFRYDFRKIRVAIFEAPIEGKTNNYSDNQYVFLVSVPNADADEGMIVWRNSIAIDDEVKGGKHIFDSKKELKEAYGVFLQKFSELENSICIYEGRVNHEGKRPQRFKC